MKLYRSEMPKFDAKHWMQSKVVYSDLTEDTSLLSAISQQSDATKEWELYIFPETTAKNLKRLLYRNGSFTLT